MSCAQVMYQPYAPSPYVVQPDTSQTATPHGSGSATTAAAAAAVAAAAAAVGDSRHSEGGGGGGGPVLHHPQPSTSSITPHTPPHAHHHHHQQQQQQQQPLPQPLIPRTNEAAGSSTSQVQQQGQQQQTPQHTTQQQQQQQTQGQQQQPQTPSSESSGAQRSLPRQPYRAPSNGSATADPDAPPPEKKFCSDIEAPRTPATPSSSSSSSLPHGHHPHHHQGSQPQHSHHHHHHHHSHHHPPDTEATGSPSQHSNQQEVKYVSANCMVVTHYAGDTSAVVDEHFTRALSTPHYEKPHSPGKAASPMSSRNFPPSFWNSNYQIPSTTSSRPPSLAGHLAGASPAELYDPYHGGLHSLQHPAPDPWAAYSLSSQAYGHRSVAHDVYQAAMSSVPSSSRPYHQYSSLAFQPHLARLPGVTPVASQMPMAKPESWGARYHEAFTNPELAHGLETNYAAAHYSNVPGLETGVPQEGAKDLYWF